MRAISGSGKVTMTHMVRFARGRNLAIGFGILPHGAVFVDLEDQSAFAQTRLRIKNGKARVCQHRNRKKWTCESKDQQANQGAKNIKEALAQFIKPADVQPIYERANDPIGFEVMNGHAPGHLLILNRHAGDFHTLFLRVQNGLKCRTLDLAIDRNHQIRNMIDIDQAEQMETGTQHA